MTTTPRVSVVMPVYNGERFLATAVESILGQTFGDFEFIIVDDGSTDRTPEMLAAIAERDARVRVIRQANGGVVSALNAGCAAARGEFLARMDADDISLPQRFALQVAFLDANPEVGVVGTAGRFLIDGKLREFFRFPTLPGVLDWAMIWENSLAHPSVMLRREVFERVGGYRAAARHVEDYDLWLRARQVARLANLPEVLLHYRLHGGSICAQHVDAQRETGDSVVREHLAAWLGLEISAETMSALRRLPARPDLARVEAIADLLRQLHAAFVKSVTLTPAEDAAVRMGAGRVMFSLFLRAWRAAPGKSWPYLAETGRLHPLALLAAPATIFANLGKGCARTLLRRTLRSRYV